MVHNYFCEKPEQNADCKWLGETVVIQLNVQGITGEFKNIHVCNKKKEDGPCFHQLIRLRNMMVKKNKDDQPNKQKD